MKHMIKLPAVLLGLLLLLTGINQKVMAQNEDISLQSFYDELSPYGTWIQDPQYGYVWRPDVDQEEFRPYYTNGRWAMTEYGNTWVSNYDWGWAPFHYGRWVYNRYNEWIWLPDTVWGPAWVSWRSGGGNYGWAPLGPSINIGINIGRGGYRVPDMCWNFIPYAKIYYNNYPRYNYGRNRVYIQNTVIINNTYVRNNRTYYTGPRADEIRRYTNRDVTVYNVNRSSRQGSPRFDNNTVNIYNPRPSRNSNPNPAPRNAVQGNINRGPVGRDQNAIANRNDRGQQGDRNGNNGFPGRDGRENRENSNQGGDRNSNNDNRNGFPNRSSRDNSVSSPQRDQSPRGNMPTGDRSAIGSRPNGFERRGDGNNSQPQRVDRGNAPVERQPQVEPQRVERSREMPQQQPQRTERVERQQPVQQQQAPQQRMERPQPQQRTERVERAQPQPQQQRSSGNEGGGRQGGGRPGRG